MATTGITDYIVYAVAQLKVKFSCTTESRTFGATGFWIGNGPGRPCAFVTNRHNVDPAMRFPGEFWSLASAQIALRRGRTEDETKFFTVDLEAADLRLAEDGSDCAAFLKPTFEGLDDTSEFKDLGCYAAKHEIADAAWLANEIDLMDFASFVGFAGGRGRDTEQRLQWWDHARNLPIARFATIASLTDKSFTNDNLLAKNVGVVSGLSFEGSSGSPLIAHHKGIQVGQTLGIQRPPGMQVGFQRDSYTPAKLIGIMSGHWNDTGWPAAHSGLSYYTRSDSILKLLPHGWWDD
jgi:hypothetical protein